MRLTASGRHNRNERDAQFCVSCVRGHHADPIGVPAMIGCSISNIEGEVPELTVAVDNSGAKAEIASVSTTLTISTNTAPHPTNNRKSFLLLAPCDRVSVKLRQPSLSPHNCALACDRLTGPDTRTRFASGASGMPLECAA